MFVAAFFLLLGRLVIEALPAARPLDGIARWGLALCGTLLYVLALMGAHVLSGGRVLSQPWVTRAVTVGAFAVLSLRALGAHRRLRGSVARGAQTRDLRGPLAVSIVGIAAVVVWGAPVFRILPLDSFGDTVLHTGWTSQLLNGEPTPSATITGDIPNFYPWLFHALLATLARFTPGGRAFHALGAVHVLQVVGSALCLLALGRVVTGSLRGGAATTLLGGFTGGLGFFLLRSIDVVEDPRADGLRYLGDLLYKRSYNSSFFQLAPAFPRDLAWSLLIGALVLVVVGLRLRSSDALVFSGAVLGLVGLTGAEAFAVGLCTLTLLVAFSSGSSRRRDLAHVLLPALGVYSLWLVPQAVNYMSLGGYVHLTAVEPVTLPPRAVLVSWGIVTPLAAVGAARSLGRVRLDIGVRAAALLAATAGALVVTSVAVPSVLGDAFETLGRPHRYWPLLHFGAVLFAALGAVHLLDGAARWGRGARLAAWAALVALAVPSPVVASTAVGRGLAQGTVLARSLRGEEGALLNLVAPASSGRCRAAVPAALDSRVWAYTGYRLVSYSWAGPEPRNRARIRWRDIYERITPEARRARDNLALTLAVGGPGSWRATAARYGVDVVVVPASRARAGALTGLRGRYADDLPYVVFRLTDCGT